LGQTLLIVFLSVSKWPPKLIGEFALQQRVRNLPSNRVFEVGWLRRIATYHRPIADPESSPKRAPRKSLRVTAAQ
jgi:hypothetical protein